METLGNLCSVLYFGPKLTEITEVLLLNTFSMLYLSALA